MKKTLYLFILIFLLYSCDGIYDYTYIVSNETNFTIQIDVKTKTWEIIDSTFFVEKNRTDTLFIVDHGVEGGNGPHFNHLFEDIDSFIVSIGDTIFSKRNFIEDDEWTYSDGVYSTLITEEEFE
jgi:hypothetical protein